MRRLQLNNLTRFHENGGHKMQPIAVCCASKMPLASAGIP